MFSIYIKNFLDPNSSNQLNTSEVKLFDIPENNSSANFLIDPKMNLEMGKAGSFEFKMEPDHPYYNAFRQMKTIMRVECEGETLFRGRVLTIDNTMYGEKSVHLEGDLTFLLDSYQEAVKSEKQVKKALSTYIEEVITAHNDAVEGEKQFNYGQIPGHYSGLPAEMQIIIDTSIDDATKKYNTDSWTQTLSALDSLAGQYGGYWRTRYRGGTVYLDWLKNYFDPNINAQPMKIGSNLINLSNTLEVNNIFTAIIPIGSRKGKALYLDSRLGHKYMTVPQITEWYSDSELNTAFHTATEYRSAVDNFGWIYKTVQFSNADTVDTLFKYAKDWIKNNYHGGISSFSISALDLHLAGEDVPTYHIGDLVRVIYPNPMGGADLEGTYVCMKISYDLYNPENNQYTVGIPDMALNKTYGETKTTKTSSPSSKSSTQSGDTLSSLLGLGDDEEATKNNLLYKVWRFMDTGEWPEDGGEAATDNTTTTNDAMDDEDKFDIISILKGDGGKFNMFDGVLGNFNTILTVGGNNTVNALTHMAEGETGGTWQSTSPIILDGRTGNITSKKGTVSIQDLNVGYDWDDAGGYDAWINWSGQLGCTDVHITAKRGTQGRLVIDNELGSGQSSHSIYIKSGDGNITHSGDGSVMLQGGSFHTLYGDFDTFSGYFETMTGSMKAPTIGANTIYTQYSVSDGLSGDDLAAKAFVDCSASEKDGVITFKFWGPNQAQTETPIKTVNFNMADTQFFKDAVEAAYDEGYDDGYEDGEAAGAAVTIDITADKDNAYDEKSGTQIFTDVTFTSGKWYRFKVTAGDSEKSYTFKVVT